MVKPIRRLVQEQESAVYPNSTVYIALISGDLTLNMATTVDPATNILTTATAHLLITGTRIRLAVAGGSGDYLPGAANGTIDYFAIVLTPTTLKLASSLANATASTPTEVDLTSSGQGVVLNQQQLVADDPNAVILARELASGNGYTQRFTSTVGNSTVSGVEAWQTSQPVNIAAVGGPIIYRHVALLLNANTTIGDTYGDLIDLRTETANITIGTGDIKTLVERFINQRA